MEVNNKLFYVWIRQCMHWRVQHRIISAHVAVWLYVYMFILSDVKESYNNNNNNLQYLIQDQDVLAWNR